MWAKREAHLLVTSTKLVQPSFCLVNRLDPFLRFGKPVLEGVGEGFEPGVQLDHT